MDVRRNRSQSGHTPRRSRWRLLSDPGSFPKGMLDLPWSRRDGRGKDQLPAVRKSLAVDAARTSHPGHRSVDVSSELSSDLKVLARMQLDGVRHVFLSQVIIPSYVRQAISTCSDTMFPAKVLKISPDLSRHDIWSAGRRKSNHDRRNERYLAATTSLAHRPGATRRHTEISPRRFRR